MSVCLPVCLSVCMSFCLSVCLSLCLSIHLCLSGSEQLSLSVYSCPSSFFLCCSLPFSPLIHIHTHTPIQMHPLAPTVTHAHAHPHHQTKTLTRLHTYTHTLLVPGIHGSTPFAKAVKFRHLASWHFRSKTLPGIRKRFHSKICASEIFLAS